ncbi:MAG: AEC family transporter [Bacteroidales bacterium]|nr:AEC family transporter [Bacteroidales bacterium]
MQAGIVISQIFVLAVVVIIGVIAARFRVLTIDTKDMLSKVIFNISLPLMLLTNFLTIEATPRLIANSLTVLLITALIIFFMLFVGWMTTGIFKITGKEAAVFRVHSMFGNTIFLGFPLITSLFGQEGLLYASMYQLVSTIIMWSAGVIVLTHNRETSLRSSIMRVVNPNTIATLIGFILFLFSVRVPEIIVRPLAELGAANTWLSMLYIGAMLALSDVGGVLGKKSPYILSFNRLVFIPAVLITVFVMFAAVMGTTPDKLVLSVIILEASMPCMASVVIMAKEFNSDDRLAVGNVFVSTMLSIVTLPLLVMALNRFL